MCKYELHMNTIYIFTGNYAIEVIFIVFVVLIEIIHLDAPVLYGNYI